MRINALLIVILSRSSCKSEQAGQPEREKICVYHLFSTTIYTFLNVCGIRQIFYFGPLCLCFVSSSASVGSRTIPTFQSRSVKRWLTKILVGSCWCWPHIHFLVMLFISIFSFDFFAFHSDAPKYFHQRNLLVHYIWAKTCIQIFWCQ